MKWSSDTIDRVRSAHDIVEWIGRDTVLKGSSSDRYMGLCPFPDHQEKTPSFCVSANRQFYYCFGCSRGGNIFTYLKDLKGMNFPSAVEYLAGQAGIPLTKRESGFADSKKDLSLKLNREVCDFFHQCLLNLPPPHQAWKYLKGRGYSKEMVQQFRMGYAPLKNELTKKLGGKKKLLIELGLAREKNNQVFDLFRGRLMFPIISPMNKVLGFGGRSLGSSLPKYINSRESACFQKGRMFYGLNESGGMIRQKGYALVVEGYTDFLTLFQNGFQNAVAVLGTALTSHHARLLKRYTDKVILFFDGDSAGDKASLRSLPILLAEGLRVHCLELKDMDPDECIKKHGAVFLKSALSRNQDFFLHIFSKKTAGSQRDIDRLDILQSMIPYLCAVKDEVLKEYYTRRLLDMFSSAEQNMASKALKKYENKHLSRARSVDPFSKANEQSPPVEEERFSLKQTSQTEIYLLALALHNPAYLMHIRSRLDLNQISQAGLRKVFEKIFNRYDKNQQCFSQLLSQTAGWVHPESWLYTAGHPVLKDLDGKTAIAFIDDCLKKILIDSENIRLKTLILQLKSDQSNKHKYLGQIQSIKKNILSMEKSK